MGDIETVFHLMIGNNEVAVVWALEDWDDDPKGIRVLRTRDYTDYRYVVLVSKALVEETRATDTFIILSQAIEAAVAQVAKMDDAEGR